MKRFLCIVFVSAVLGVILGGGTAFLLLTINGWQPALEYGQPGELTKRTTNVNAKASIEETVFDFGAKDVKTSGKHEFFIKNAGTADLTLKLDRKTCTCTDIEIIPSRVKPGETAKAILSYNAERATSGQYQQGGTLVTNDPENQEIMLLVRGIFTSPVVIRPSALELPNVPVVSDYTATLRIYGFEKEPLKLSAPEWDDKEHFSLEWKETELTESNKADPLLKFAHSVTEAAITIKSGLPLGMFVQKFRLKTNYPNDPVVEFFVRGQVTGGTVSISGYGFNKSTGIDVLGKTVAGQKLTRDISIQFSGLTASTTELKVKEVSPAWVKTTVAPPRDAGRMRIFSVTIEIPADAPAGNYMYLTETESAFVSLETNDPNVPVLKIPIQFSIER
jgi:hypothetical protein